MRLVPPMTSATWPSSRKRSIMELDPRRLEDDDAKGSHGSFPHRHFKSSGATRRGRINGMSGQMMMAASMSNIGISMIRVSLRAYRIGTPATEQEIIRQRP